VITAGTGTAECTVTSRDGTAISYLTVGEGDGVLVLGGAWRAAGDYLAFGRALADRFAVHLIDRRGRGRSGPQGPDYCIEREIEDLIAVQARTGATKVFGHSYGGLIALEAARRSTAFTDVVVYEPGVSIGGSIPTGWMTPYGELLAAGDRRGAFAVMVRGAGGAPPIVERLPVWYLRLLLRVFIRDRAWQRIDSLMEASLVEHAQVGALDDGTADRFRAVTARTVLLGGGKSRSRFTTVPFAALTAAIPDVTAEIIPGLDHVAPDEKAPDRVAARVREYLSR
jgi:pimeloyl-ACP methyl ester carboxylesterase